MEALRQHFVHHRLHMIGCGVGSLALIAGIVIHLPILAISGAVVCGAFCLDMARMMLATRPKRG
jgi:hypothetical protein